RPFFKVLGRIAKSFSICWACFGPLGPKIIVALTRSLVHYCRASPPLTRRRPIWAGAGRLTPVEKIFNLTRHVGVSSNGRTSDSGSDYRGSNPCTPTNSLSLPEIAQQRPLLPEGSFFRHVV